MKTWQSRTIGVLTFGGSVLGCGLMAIYFLESWPNLLAMTLLALFAIVFGYGTFLGVRILQGSEQSLVDAIPFWAAQIPFLTTKYLSFTFNTGGAIWLSMDMEGTFHFKWYVGAYAIINFGAEVTASFGVNLLAVVIVVMLLRHKRARLDQDSALLKPEAPSDEQNPAGADQREM